MLCRYRTSRAAGTYYASRRTELPQLIFAEPRDYEEFEVFLADALERTGTGLLGYCWMPDAIHLALTIGVTPLAEIMRRVTRYCSLRIRERTGGPVNYTGSFPIMLPKPDIDLPMLLRYIHCIPVIAGAAASPADYPYTSHWAYVREPQAAQVRTHALHKLIHVPRLH